MDINFFMNSLTNVLKSVGQVPANKVSRKVDHHF
jgi:hypothetical protein